MNPSPRIGTLIAESWIILFGIWFAVGVFVPRFRMRWGRWKRGPRMSALTQVVWAVSFIFLGTAEILSECHHALPPSIFPITLVPLFVAMVTMFFYDNIKAKTDPGDEPW